MARRAAKPGKVAIKAAVALALACALSWYPRAAQAASLTPSPASVGAGNSVTLTLSDSVSAADTISGIDLQVTFDPLLLSFDGVADGSLLITDGWDAPTFNPTTGSVSVFEDLGSDLSGTDAPLLTLTFSALASDATGTATVVVQTSTDGMGAPDTYQLLPLSDTIDITARAVPAPGLACFLLPGLALIGIRARARSRKAA